MLPDNVLSSTPLPDEFLIPRNGTKELLTDFEIGGVDLNDASQGLQVVVWMAQLNGSGQVEIRTETVGPYVITDEPGEISEFSFTFDQNMRPFVAYVADGVSKYRWFDTLLPGFRLEELADGTVTPRCALDDKHPLAAETSDIILAYVRAGSLYYRQQRDRYEIERLLFEGLDGQTVFVNCGMNGGNRFQFEFSNGNDMMNCDCESESPYRSLAQLRKSMMIRLGYAAMSDNPPPGMVYLLDEFLQDAQRQLVLKNPDLRTTRFFKWTTTIGGRYYGLPNDEACCDLHLDARRVKWVGFEDIESGEWTQLKEGIPPEIYTDVAKPGRPTRYEIRSCIEIFPAPDKPYRLWIKGDFGVTAFVNPEHKASIDDHLLFLLALGNAKAHYGQKDAQSVINQAGTYLLDLKASKHLTARYIPGRNNLWSPLPRPVMVEFDDE